MPATEPNSLLSNTFRLARTYSVVLLITFLLLELCLTFLDPILFKGFFQYDEELGFRVRPYTNGSNEFGFNDIDRPHAKPDNTYRIVILGDSFNWASGVSCNYIGVLGEKLKSETIGGKQIEVMNVGYPATGPYDGFLALQRYGLQYDPDLVILGFFTGNDFEDPNKKMIVVNANLYRIDRRREFSLFGAPIIPGSRLAEMISQHRKIAEGTDTKNTESRDARPQRKCGNVEKPPRFTENAFLNIVSLKLSFLDRNNEDHYKPWIEFTKGTISAMHEYLRERQIDFKVALLPDELQVNPALVDAALSYRQHSKNDLEIYRPQRIMQSILSAQEIEFLDLLPVFRTAFANAPEMSLYLPRDTHWNNRGNRLAAETLYEWLSADLLDADKSAALDNNPTTN